MIGCGCAQIGGMVEHSNNNGVPVAAVLIIGNEILSGGTQDINTSYIARKLAGIGVPLREVRIVPDVEEEIISSVNALRARYTYVFTTGGIGPTHDDITSASIAKAFGVSLIKHPEALSRLAAFYTGGNLNAARVRMAYVPDGAELIDNPVSVAPGFKIENVYVLAGVPMVMQAMMDAITSSLRRGPAILNATVKCKVPESLIAEGLSSIAEKHTQLDIGSYPSFFPDGVGLSLIVRGTDEEEIKVAVREIRELVSPLDDGVSVEF